jgi:hypothetical protein
MTKHRYASGTRRRSGAISSCPSGRRALKIGMKRRSPSWSRAIR